MAYVALLLIALVAVVAYVPGLPADIGGVPLAPVTGTVRSAVGAVRERASSWAGVLRGKMMAMLREQLHGVVDETVR